MDPAQQHRLAHSDGKDQQGGNPRRPVIRRAVDILPAAVFLADNDDHDVVDRHVSPEGDEGNRRFPPGEDDAGFHKLEQDDRQQRDDDMHPEIHAGDGVFSCGRKEDQQAGGHRDGKSHRSAVLEKQNPARKHKALVMNALHRVGKHEGRAGRREEIGKHGKISQRS